MLDVYQALGVRRIIPSYNVRNAMGGEDAEKATIQAIDYVVQKTAAKHVALGSDFLIFPSESYIAFHEAQSLFYPGNYLKTMKRADDWTSLSPRHTYDLIEKLIQLGYTFEDIQGILGENYLRCLRSTNP